MSKPGNRKGLSHIGTDSIQTAPGDETTRDSEDMKQDWLSRLREPESGWNDPAFPDREATHKEQPMNAPETLDWTADETEALPQGKRIAALSILGILALGWVVLVITNGVDPAIAQRWAWLVNLIAVAATPLLLIGGLAAWILRGTAASTTFDPRRAETVTAQARQAAILLGEVQGQLVGQTQETAALAERSTQSILSSIAEIATQSGQLEQSSANSIASVGALGARVTAMVDTLPRLEDRLATLSETLERLGGNLSARQDAMDQQLQATALVAEEARLQLLGAGKALGVQLGGLRNGAQETGQELANLAELSSARLDLTIDRVQSVLAATEQRIEAQNASLAALVDQSRAEIEAASAGTLDAFSEHCREIEALLESLNTRVNGQAERSQSWLLGTAQGVATLNGAFDTLEQSAIARTGQLAGTMTQLSGDTKRLIDSLTDGHVGAQQLITQAEALLLALDSGVRELDESLPAAIGRVDVQLNAMHERIRAAGPALEGVEAVATGVVSQLREADTVAGTQVAGLTKALSKSQNALTEQKAQVSSLADAVEETGKSMTQLAASIGPQMVETLVRVRETADAAATRAREAISRVIPGAANDLAVASSAAVTKALAGTVSSELERLSLVADDAAKTAHRVTEKLTQQMKSLTDASQALDRTLETSSERMGAQDRELMAERSAQLITTLGERAIDVSKWLDKDVPEADWAAYLKGDQGLFARRATKLMSSTEAKEVHSLYQEDGAFREHVNRYVHDFEMLLRTVMATKDGGTLALTMVSSDIGKLYVALAQAIERLRPN